MKTQIACIGILFALFVFCVHRSAQSTAPPYIDRAPVLKDGQIAPSHGDPVPPEASRKVSPSKARVAQQKAYEDSLLRSQCLAAEQHLQDEQRRQLEQRLEEMKKEFCGGTCPEVIPIPPERPQQYPLKKASAL